MDTARFESRYPSQENGGSPNYRIVAMLLVEVPLYYPAILPSYIDPGI
ncbi:MAG: hypothetical protein ACFFFG_15205 [Candidatus Thorarchaeota archaeon]